jgi:hypothetical protein
MCPVYSTRKSTPSTSGGATASAACSVAGSAGGFGAGLLGRGSLGVDFTDIMLV